MDGTSTAMYTACILQVLPYCHESIFSHIVVSYTVAIAARDIDKVGLRLQTIIMVPVKAR